MCDQPNDRLPVRVRVRSIISGVVKINLFDPLPLPFVGVFEAESKKGLRSGSGLGLGDAWKKA